MVTESYYDILQCQPDATIADIKRNYQRLVLENHPDKNSKDTDYFIQIDLAWKTLRDPDKRKIYDAELFRMKFDEQSNVFATLSLGDFSESSSGELQYPCRCGSYYICDIENIDTSDDFELECSECSLVVVISTNCR